MSNTADPKPERISAPWRGHTVASGVLRTLLFLSPLAVAGAAGVLASRALAGDGGRVVAARVIATAVVSVTTFLVVERGARRFLPLAALLRLNLVFPDRAPSRFSVALRSSSLRRLERLVAEARQADDIVVVAEKVVTLAAALNTHDRRTRGHCERTRALADLIIDELRLTPTEANQVRWGAFLHDVGKLVVPAEILNKPGKPTAREWEILRRHPEAGARLVEPLRSFLSSGVDAVGSHHENFDGSGYPAGLHGHRLPLAARIVSVADSFEVMTAVRSYKRPMSLQAARTELARRSGTQFDPQVVRAFLTISLGRLHWTLGVAAWLAELPFLTLIPRVAAQLSPAGAGSQLLQIPLPGVAAASLGAMAVLPPIAQPTASGRVPAVAARAQSTAAPSPAPAPAARTVTTTTVPVADAGGAIVGLTGTTTGTPSLASTVRSTMTGAATTAAEVTDELPAVAGVVDSVDTDVSASARRLSTTKVTETPAADATAAVSHVLADVADPSATLASGTGSTTISLP